MFKYSYGFMILPGGIGMMEELSEPLTLKQRHKILNFPLVLMSRGYWEPLMPLLHKMIERYMILPKDFRYILLTDFIEEAMEHLQKYAAAQYHAKRRRVFLRFAFWEE